MKCASKKSTCRVLWRRRNDTSYTGSPLLEEQDSRKSHWHCQRWSRANIAQRGISPLKKKNMKETVLYIAVRGRSHDQVEESVVTRDLDSSLNDEDSWKRCSERVWRRVSCIVTLCHTCCKMIQLRGLSHHPPIAPPSSTLPPS